MGLLQCPNAFLVFWLIPLVQAYTVFETNCSAPATLSNYVSSPNTRGTLDILWSSLFTIFACTWTLQHPNVPAQRDDSRSGQSKHVKWMSAQWRSAQWSTAKWGLKSLYKSTLRMLCTILAPELIMTTAWFDWVAAHNNCRDMQRFAENDGVAWTLTHSYFANMGGFVIRGKPTKEQKHHDPYHLNGDLIYQLRDAEHIEKLPTITEEEIKDKSKGDIFVKLIALGQIIWSTIQIIARAVRRLPVSPLEVAVVAFAISAVFIYGLYWNKPQRVGVTQTIQLKNNNMQNERAKLERSTIYSKTVLFEGLLSLLGIEIETETLPGAPISLDSAREAGAWETAGVVGVGAAVFGGIHVVAWNFAFPSTVELILWRCASIYTAAAPLCPMLLDYIYNELGFHICIGEGFIGAFYLFSASFYVIARLFILVEMFRTLCFLPPGSYISTWTTNMPHLA
ncbi:hypothetical protein CI102_11309 [Trichoderma harzianum]|nr:hypothetical protein CI102_11309 [Trichoderma harzianum]